MLKFLLTSFLPSLLLSSVSSSLSLLTHFPTAGLNNTAPSALMLARPRLSLPFPSRALLLALPALAVRTLMDCDKACAQVATAWDWRRRWRSGRRQPWESRETSNQTSTAKQLSVAR
ncbi:hypothetical protein V8E36_000947 [Tilletia maclaganii]